MRVPRRAGALTRTLTLTLTHPHPHPHPHPVTPTPLHQRTLAPRGLTCSWRDARGAQIILRARTSCPHQARTKGRPRLLCSASTSEFNHRCGRWLTDDDKAKLNELSNRRRRRAERSRRHRPPTTHARLPSHCGLAGGSSELHVKRHHSTVACFWVLCGKVVLPSIVSVHALSPSPLKSCILLVYERVVTTSRLS